MGALKEGSMGTMKERGKYGSIEGRGEYGNNEGKGKGEKRKYTILTGYSHYIMPRLRRGHDLVYI